MAFLSNPVVLYGVAIGALWWLKSAFQRHQTNPTNLPLPPGPKGYPIIGALLDFPTYRPWLIYDQWFKVYGDMIYFKVLGKSFLVLNSLEKVNDLLERRSSIYSDRPRFPMMVEKMGMGFIFGLIPYGNWWRRHRRCFHNQFHSNAIDKYQPIQLSNTRSFLRRLLKSPDDLVGHIRHTFASLIIRVAYGITVQEENDPLVANIEISTQGFSEAGNPGMFLVDLFPWMKVIPTWFPGAGWTKKAERWRNINKFVTDVPWALVKEQVKEGKAVPSVATALIAALPDEDAHNRLEEEIVARNTCAVAYVAGADTTVSTVHTFFMAMCLYPDVQKRAQAELDGVLGGRLPEFNDRPNLPYLEAMMKESMRWQQVVPLGVAHVNREADEYNGYYIPKGTIVLANQWPILHDPEVFPDPLKFNPDRYFKDGKLNTAIRDPNVAFFGFGRRICPGRHFSDATLFSIVSHVLAVYDIRPGLDGDGKEVEIKPEMTNGFFSYPQPFACRVTPRSKEARELIQNSGLMD